MQLPHAWSAPQRPLDCPCRTSLWGSRSGQLMQPQLEAGLVEAASGAPINSLPAPEQWPQITCVNDLARQRSFHDGIWYRHLVFSTTVEPGLCEGGHTGGLCVACFIIPTSAFSTLSTTQLEKKIIKYSPNIPGLLPQSSSPTLFKLTHHTCVHFTLALFLPLRIYAPWKDKQTTLCKLDVITHRWESSCNPCWFNPPPLCPKLTINHAPHCHKGMERKGKSRETIAWKLKKHKSQ